MQYVFKNTENEKLIGMILEYSERTSARSQMICLVVKFQQMD